ncbi:hypothetical protein HanIR_Chr01g0045511 [Helianthus annuus]|nr:hypothetical protein HanIR_Chr01g0045511 [Helianthus annuus]
MSHIYILTSRVIWPNSKLVSPGSSCLSSFIGLGPNRIRWALPKPEVESPSKTEPLPPIAWLGPNTPIFFLIFKCEFTCEPTSTTASLILIVCSPRVCITSMHSQNLKYATCSSGNSIFLSSRTFSIYEYKSSPNWSPTISSENSTSSLAIKLLTIFGILEEIFKRFVISIFCGTTEPTSLAIKIFELLTKDDESLDRPPSNKIDFE